jgi:hypothetical protein
VRGFWILLAAVLGSIGIGIGVEAGGVASGPKPVFKAAVNSLGGSPYLEMDLTATLPLSGVTKEVMSGAVVTIETASADGHTFLNALPSPAAANAQISIAERGNDLADIRVIANSRVYFRVFPDRIARLPFVPASARQQLSLVGALLGGQWFSLPKSIVGSLGRLPSSTDAPALRAKERAAALRFQNDLLTVAKISSRPAASGTETSATISLHALVTIAERDVVPVVDQALGRSAPPLRGAAAKADQANGTGTLDLVTGSNDTTMRSASLVIVSDGKRGTGNAVIRHDGVDLGPPAGARALPQSILGQIGSLGSASIS